MPSVRKESRNPAGRKCKIGRVAVGMRPSPPSARPAARPPPPLPTQYGNNTMSLPDSSKLLLGVVLCWIAPGVAVAAEPQAPTAEQVRFFESQVRPVLVEQC